MPIYEQMYRSYEGGLRQRLRWGVIVLQELRVLFAARPFIVLLIVAVMHFSFRVFQVISYDLLASDPNNPIAATLRNVAMMVVNEKMFHDYLLLQCPLVFLISLYAGSGMICNDFRNNLMEVYFSKPISWRDYALGKVMTLVGIGLALTAVPAIILVVLHNLLAPSWATLRETSSYPVSITLFSLVIVGPCALGVLASSSLFRSQRFAGIGVFMVLFTNGALGALLAELLHKPHYSVLAFPVAVNRIGERLFHSQHVTAEVSLGGSVAFVAIVCSVALWVVCRRARQGEVAV